MVGGALSISVSILSLRVQNGGYTRVRSRIDHQVAMGAQQFDKTRWLLELG